MKNYVVKEGTPGILVTQNGMADIKSQKWAALKDLLFTIEQVVINPEIDIFRPERYPNGSLAAQLISNDYFLFSINGWRWKSKYLLAIKHCNLVINNE